MERVVLVVVLTTVISLISLISAVLQTTGQDEEVSTAKPSQDRARARAHSTAH